jgi:hypothetical protein
MNDSGTVTVTEETMRRNHAAWVTVGGLAVTLWAVPREAFAQEAALSAPGLAAARAPERQAGREVTLSLRDVPLRAALQMLFEGSGRQHAVEPAVPNVPITLDIRAVPFDTALRMLTRLAGVTFSKDGEIFIVRQRQPAPELLAQNPYDPPAPVEPAAAAGGATWEKIPLNYIHPVVLAAVLGGQVIPTEDQVIGGLGGYGGGLGGYGGLGGLNAGGGYGLPNTGGLGNFGNSSLNGGFPNAGFNNGGGTNGAFSLPAQGTGSNLGWYPQGNSAIVGPRSRRF